MERGLVFAWIALLMTTLIYLGLLYRNKQYRHRSALARLIFLIALLFLLRPLPEIISTKKQDLFVLVDTSKSMQPHLVNQTEFETVQNMLPPQLLQTIESRYPAYEKYYFDLYRPTQTFKDSQKQSPFKWGLHSPIVSGTLRFIEMAAPPENSRLLLISDGHDTEYEEIPQVMQEQLSQAGIVMDSLIVRGTTFNKDVAIEQVNNPRVVFSKNPASLQVTLHSNLEKAQSIHLLLTDGESILHKKVLDFPQGEHTVTTHVNWIPQDPGNSLLILRLPPLEGEKNLHNNVSYIPLTVRAHRLKVLHIAGRPSWDVLHLRSFLKSIPALDLVSFYILRDPYRDTQTVPEHELALIQFPVRELFQIELFKFDTVIFHNFAIQSYLYNPAYQQSFQKYLTSGKKIIVIGGEQAVEQEKYKQLFIKQSAGPFELRFYDFSSRSPLESQQLSRDYLRQQPAFQSVSSPSSQPLLDLIKRTYYELGQVDWILSPTLWEKQHPPGRDVFGQTGEFAAFWQTLLYQSEYEKVNVFRDFQQILPYTTANQIEGTLHFPFRSGKSLNKLHLQVLDQLLNIVVWDEPVAVAQQQAQIQLPLLSPSLYELRLSCDCPEMLDILQKLTIVDEWLEMRTTTPRVGWLQELTKLMGGEVIEI